MKYLESNSFLTWSVLFIDSISCICLVYIFYRRICGGVQKTSSKVNNMIAYEFMDICLILLLSVNHI